MENNVFAKQLEKLNWDDFHMIYMSIDLYDEEKRKIIEKEKVRRANQFNKYMSF